LPAPGAIAADDEITVPLSAESVGIGRYLSQTPVARKPVGYNVNFSTRTTRMKAPI
jgi:hypothetical protein